MRLFPSDEKVLRLLVAHANIAQEAADTLYDAVRHGGLEQLRSAAIRIGEMEQNGDEIIHEIHVWLNRNLLAPLDPEDVATLGSRFDDVLDGLEDVAYRFAAYQVDSVPESAIRFCAILGSCSQCIAEAASALANKRDVLALCGRLHALEKDADELDRSCVLALLNAGSDPITIVKWKEIYEFLERTADRCEDVADTLQSIAVKNK